jgi:predicted 2-oxoglutarate/Fe(II)-dependent dioxygenase YbiX/peroxiredoxin
MANARGWLSPGDTAPWFKAPALGGSPTYSFDTVAGRHVLMLFFGSACPEGAARALALVQESRELFDDDRACFFGVTADREDAGQGRIEQQLPGIRFFLDYGRRLSAAFGALENEVYKPHWLLLDQRLRVLGSYPLAEGEAAIRQLRECMEEPFSGDQWAPVLPVPNVFEPALCRQLIELYEKNGGEESGFMRDIGGKTVLVTDPQHKRRRDFNVEESALRDLLAARVRAKIAPALELAFRFKPTRMERYLVACYSAGAGHFRPHRDNTTKGTAHRQFAVTINLNDDFEGGDLRFPEFGRRTYRAPAGGAIVFSCSLLHEATPVTSGRRFAFLPFLYDEAAARLREENDRFLAQRSAPYRSDAAKG